MNRKALWLVGAFAACASPAFAHHGTLISYDRAKQWTKEVVVTRFNYANPHPQIFFDVPAEGAAAVAWAGELLPNPAALVRNGWTKARSVEALKPGTRIKITIAPAKAGGEVGLVLRMTDLAGNDVVTDGTPAPPAGPPPSPAATAAPSR